MLAFISYVREDSEDVLRLKEAFAEHGIECFIDTESIPPGELWEAKIRREIDRCDWFLACFSAHYSRRKSTWMNREIEIALDRHCHIFPVLLSGDIPVLPDGLDPALRMLNWISLAPDYWYLNLGRLLAAMMPGSAVRGAGLADLTRRFSTAGLHDRMDILWKLKTMMDLPEAIALVERGLLDPAEQVCTHASWFVSYSGEAGATLAARLLLNPNVDTSLQLLLLVALVSNNKAALAVPAALKMLHARLSRPADSNEVNNLLNNSQTAVMIRVLEQIGEPADVIREGLTAIQSDVPDIRRAVQEALAKLRPS